MDANAPPPPPPPGLAFLGRESWTVQLIPTRLLRLLMLFIPSTGEEAPRHGRWASCAAQDGRDSRPGEHGIPWHEVPWASPRRSPPRSTASWLWPVVGGGGGRGKGNARGSSNGSTTARQRCSSRRPGDRAAVGPERFSSPGSWFYLRSHCLAQEGSVRVGHELPGGHAGADLRLLDGHVVDVLPCLQYQLNYSLVSMCKYTIHLWPRPPRALSQPKCMLAVRAGDFTAGLGCAQFPTIWGVISPTS